MKVRTKGSKTSPTPEEVIIAERAHRKQIVEEERKAALEEMTIRENLIKDEFIQLLKKHNCKFDISVVFSTKGKPEFMLDFAALPIEN